MQLEFLDCRQATGRKLFTSAIQFYDLPVLVVGPTAETLEALFASLNLWIGVEIVTIVIGDWPPTLYSLKLH